MAIDLSHLRGTRAAILGFGASGRAAAAALRRAGVEVAGWDDGAAARAAGAASGAALRDFARDGFDGAAFLMLSPGIPRAHPAPHPAVARALREGLPIVGDIDLLYGARGGGAGGAARYLGITGTNGKSTTTALIGHVMAQAGVPAAAGGNLGPPVLDLPPLDAGGWYVLELSSYQLETLTAPRWDIGLLLNVTPDHLDRYPDMAAYVAAKRRLIAAIRPGGTAIIGVDDDHARAVADDFAAAGAGRLVRVSVERPVEDGLWVADGALWDAAAWDDAAAPGPRRVLDLAEAVALPGLHNAQNAACAWAACRAAGIAPDAVAAGIRSFPGLRHRQQRVAAAEGVVFVNDSKATNADAAAKALSSYDRIWWIAGGKPKPGGIAAVDPYLGAVRRAFLIGEAAAAFAAHLERVVPVEISGDLATATRAAFAAARADRRATTPPGEDVVLLSPACASFDQFANFEARGEAFIAVATDLARATQDEVA